MTGRKHIAPKASLPGARAHAMREMGHVPMSENPAQLRRCLLPVPDDTRGH